MESPYLCAVFNGPNMIIAMKKNLIQRGMQLILVAGCTLMMATACKQSAETQLPTGTYETMTVGTSDKELNTAYSATIRGRQDIDIYPQVSGTIQQLCVAEGDKVRQGQTLFILDQVPYQAALNTAIANVKTAEAALATAELNYDSNQELFAQKVVSDFTLTTAKNNYLTAQAALAQAEAQEVNARNNLSYTVVKSPSDGVVGTLPYRVGALVSPSISQPLTTVSDNSTMYVYFSMTENQLLSLVRQYGTMDSALVQMPDLQLRLNDQSVYEEKGRIETISGVIDRQTGTVSVRAVFPNKARLLHSGASGSILMPSTYKDCIVIPQEATVKQQDKIIVYKVVDGKAASTLIQVADVNDGRTYIVTGGLSVGDEIVSKGAGLIREGMQVK